MQTCFYCKKPVLGLSGNDEILDTAYLSSEDTDLFDNKIYGECHSICLIASSRAERWAKCRKHSLMVNQRYEFTELDDALIYTNSVCTSALVELKDSHRCVAISSWMLHQNTTCCKDIFLEHEVNWEFSRDLSRLVSEACHDLIHSPMSLQLIARLFDVEEYYSDLLLSKGYLSSTQETQDNLRLGYLSGRCSYPLNLPDQVASYLMESVFHR